MKTLTHRSVARRLMFSEFLGVGDQSGNRYFIAFEDECWIFKRHGNPRFGHSGRHHTLRQAITAAMMKVGSVFDPVFEFETQGELQRWLSNIPATEARKEGA